MPSTIFAGSKVKALKSTLSLNGGADIISSTTNPQSSAVSAEPGSLLLNTTSGTMYRKLDSGSTTNWVEVGSGGGGKNYIKNPDFDGGATTSWSMQKVSLSNFIPTGNIGAADAGHTISASSSSPLEGANSLLVDGASAFTAGNCLVSAAFAIDREDMAKVMGWSFYYEAITTNMDFSGTSAGTWAVYIAEVTTATPDTVVSWIQPAGVYNLVQGSGVGLASGTFQTTATGTAYRLVLVCINSEAAATTLKVDDFQLGPQKVVYGAPVTDWVDFPSVDAGTLITAVTTNPTYGTVAINKAQWRRVGSDMEIKWDYRQTTGGSAGSGVYLFNLPAGYSIDTSKVSVSTTADNSKSLGVLDYFDSINGFLGIGYATAYSATQLQFRVQIQGSASGSFGLISSTYGDFSAASSSYSLKAKIPIAGWSSNTVTSDSTDTRVVAARAFVNSPQTVLNGATDVIVFDGTTFDTHGAMEGSGATRGYRVKVSGKYRVSSGLFSLTFGGVNWSGLQIWKNGVEYSRVESAAGASRKSILITDEVDCVAGDLLQIKLDNISGASVVIQTGNPTYLTVERASGPATIAASESVIAVGKDSAGTSIPNNAWTNVPTATITDSTHGALSSGGVFTAPVSGRFSVSIIVAFASNSTGIRGGRIQKNGADTGAGVIISAVTTSVTVTALSAIFNLVAGDTITFQAYQNSGAPLSLYTASDVTSMISVGKIGN